jgi:hypothetical protein
VNSLDLLLMNRKFVKGAARYMLEGGRGQSKDLGGSNTSSSTSTSNIIVLVLLHKILPSTSVDGIIIVELLLLL